jgi:hypothetical protein
MAEAAGSSPVVPAISNQALTAQSAAAVQVPHLQRAVVRRGHRPLPVRRHRHAIDRTRVALQRAQQRRA